MITEKKEARQTRRFTVSLSATLEESPGTHARPTTLKATIISFSAGGCALRTTARLGRHEYFTLEVPLVIHSRPQTLRIPCEVVWGRDEYRIDTFYAHGLKFLEPLKDEFLLDVLKEEMCTASSQGRHPSYAHNKSVA